jgi:serine/threonine-protein kinase RsbW
MEANIEDVISIEIPAVTKYLNVLSECVECILKRNADILHSYIYPIQMAVHETCSNIVEHAYSGYHEGRIKVVFRLRIEEKSFEIDVYDSGNSFDIDVIAPPNLEMPKIRGYGLFIVHNLMDEVLYTPMPGNNHWCLIKHL